MLNCGEIVSENELEYEILVLEKNAKLIVEFAKY